MGENKELLIPINFDGEWNNTEEKGWVFKCSSSTFVDVCPGITYLELEEKIYEATDLNAHESDIRLTAWSQFPNMQRLPPLKIIKDRDVANYLKLYTSRIDDMIPICVTIGHKLVVPPKCHITHQESNVVVELPFVDRFWPFSAAGLDDIEIASPSKRVSNCNDDDSDGSSSDEVIPATNGCYYDEYFTVYHKGIGDSYIGVQPVPPPLWSPLPAVPLPMLPGVPPSRGFDNGSSGRSTTQQHSEHPNSAKSSAIAPPTCSTKESSNIVIVLDFFDGEIFNTKQDITLRLRLLAMKANREFRVSHSDQIMFMAVCVDKNCKWRMRATLLQKSSSWIIRKYIREHTCSLDLRFKGRRGVATARTVAEIIVHSFDSEDKNLEPNHIVTNLNKVYGITISYWKAWYAKELASKLIRGVPEDSFRGLASYLWLLQDANPGTYTSYEVESTNSFKNVFFALSVCINGFRTCIRPVIAVDATFLKGKYGGKLFIATAQDANRQIFPLAFGVAANECDVTWEWFLRHASIEKNVSLVFPDALYGICMHHLGMNMNARFKVQGGDLLYTAAKAYTVAHFQEVMSQVKHRNTAVYDYLMEDGPTKWARCHFSGRRYSVMTTNITESMNNALKTTRYFPIIGMIEMIRTKLQQWFHDRRVDASKVNTPMAKNIEDLLRACDDKSRHFRLEPIDDFRFIIRDGFRDGLVDLHVKTCTCNVFQLDQLPCKHAIKACREGHVSIYSLYSGYYTNDTTKLAYSIPIMHVPHRSQWELLVPEEVRNETIKPPPVVNKRGRPKNKRIASQGEDEERRPKPTGISSMRKCSKCHGFGHNKKTCTGMEYVPPDG